MCDGNMPKFLTFISRQQSYFAMFEVSFNPITMFYTMMERYFDCAISYIFYGQFIRLHSCIYDESAGHIREAQ